MIGRVLGCKRRCRLVLTLMALAALAAGSWGVLSAVALSRTGTAGGCISYRTSAIPRGALCMKMPWQLVGAGPYARGVMITVPGQVCATGPSGGALAPSAMVHRTRSAFHIEVVARRAAHGRFQTNCDVRFGLTVNFQVPIQGRAIGGESWPSSLHYGVFRGYVLGLPRLLGLSPGQARRVLWLEGFHSRLSGRGREIVAQVPGWGLVGQDRSKPDPYSGIAMLRAGERIRIPTRPATKPGSATGTITGAIRFEGGPSPTQQSPSKGGLSGVVDLFNAQGRLLARFRVRAKHAFHLRLTPGHYLLKEDSETFCSPTPALVHAGANTGIIVGVGCGIP